MTIRKDNKPHLLVVRLSAMGDVAMLVPVLKAVREANPGLRITLLTRPFFRPLFREVDGLEFLDPDFRGRHRGLAGLIRLRNDIDAVGVTHVADVHEVPRTKLLRRLLRAVGTKVAVIDKGKDEKRELTRKFRKQMQQLPTTVERYCATIRELGFEFRDPEAADHIEHPIPFAIGQSEGEKDGPWIGIAPFAKYKGKIYPTTHTDRLIGLLAERYARVFIFGSGPYEKEFAEYMQGRHPGVRSVIGTMKLDEELDLLSNLEAIVTMDAAPMHMASLVGIPAISVWGATHPFAGSYGFGQNPENAIQRDLHCRPCCLTGEKTCLYKDYRCLTGIEPEAIIEKLEMAVGLPDKKKKKSGSPPSPRRRVPRVAEEQRDQSEASV